MRKVIFALLTVGWVMMMESNVVWADTVQEAFSSEEQGKKVQEIISNKELELIEEGKFPTVYFATYGTYEQVEGWQQTVKTKLQNAMENVSCEVIDFSELDITYNSKNREELSRIYSELINENPKYFYIGGYTYSYYEGDEGKIIGIQLIYDSDYRKDTKGFQPNVEKILKDRSIYVAGINNVLQCVENSMTDLEKVLAVHDWIVRECDYDYQNYVNGMIPNSSYSDTGVFINGSAVCNGYALAFSVLMQQLNIPSYFVGSNSMNHAWNLVYVDKTWYHIDTTWDDPVWDNSTQYGYSNNDYADEGYVSHKYFMLSDEEIRNKEHSGWSTNVPSASVSGKYIDYCFYNKNVSMNYYNGYWYYSSGNKIICSLISGTPKTCYTAKAHIMYLHSYNGKIYYTLAGTKNSIYSIPFEQFTESSCMPTLNPDVENQKTMGYNVTEFSIKKNNLIVVYVKDSDKTVFQRKEYEIKRKPMNISIINYPEKLVYKYGETLNLKGLLLKCVYEDGQEEIYDGYSTSGYLSKKYGEQKITIEYKGLTTSFYVWNVPNKIAAPAVTIQSNESIALKWDKIAGADAYKIYRKETKDTQYICLGETTDTNFEDKNDIKETTYEYKVVANNRLNEKTLVAPESESISIVMKMDYVELNGICYMINEAGIDVGVAYDTNSTNVQFKWLSYNLDTKEWKEITGWYNGNWVTWKPNKGNYWLQVQAKTTLGTTATYTICFAVDKNYNEKFLKLNGFCYIMQTDRIDFGVSYDSSDYNTKFRWLSYNLDTKKWEQISDWYNGNWMTWKPKTGNYWVQVQAKTENGIEKSDTMCFKVDRNYTDTLSLDGICYITKESGIDVGVAYSCTESNVQFRWQAYNLDKKEWEKITEWHSGNWMTWKPEVGNYWLYVEAKTAGGLSENYIQCFNVSEGFKN